MLGVSGKFEWERKEEKLKERKEKAREIEMRNGRQTKVEEFHQQTLPTKQLVRTHVALSNSNIIRTNSNQNGTVVESSSTISGHFCESGSSVRSAEQQYSAFASEATTGRRM